MMSMVNRRETLVCLLLLLFTAYCSSLTVYSQSRGWLWQNPLPQGNMLYAVSFSTDNLQWLGGGRGRRDSTHG
ncbi:MAG: hypothetical protein WKF84_16770 [Pyrinomonadaceae bacterium]